MDEDTFYKEIDYPDVGGHVSFYAVRDGDDPRLWHGVYELAYRSSGIYGDGTPEFELGRRDVRVPEDELAEDYLADACCDGEEPAIPPSIYGKWVMDADLCDMAELYDARAMTLREMLAEFEGGMLADRYDEYAAFARANGWNLTQDGDR